VTTPAVQRMALELFSLKASLVATNVPGPQMPLYLAGSRVSELMFWVPQNGSIGIGISILSYNGKVHFGLISDAKRIADPGDVIRRFRGEFEKLLYITLMEDWEQPITPEDADATLGFFCGNAGGPVSKDFVEACAEQKQGGKAAVDQASTKASRPAGEGKAEPKRAASPRRRATPAAPAKQAKPATAKRSATDVKPKPRPAKRKAPAPAATEASEFARRLAALRKS
jgi:hypothetical protein